MNVWLLITEGFWDEYPTVAGVFASEAAARTAATEDPERYAYGYTVEEWPVQG